MAHAAQVAARGYERRVCILLYRSCRDRLFRKNYAFYPIVIADSRAPRDGKFIERIGSYNPNTNPATVTFSFLLGYFLGFCLVLGSFSLKTLFVLKFFLAGY